MAAPATVRLAADRLQHTDLGHFLKGLDLKAANDQHADQQGKACCVFRVLCWAVYPIARMAWALFAISIPSTRFRMRAAVRSNWEGSSN
jgi:hypothetical protein